MVDKIAPPKLFDPEDEDGPREPWKGEPPDEEGMYDPSLEDESIYEGIDEDDDDFDDITPYDLRPEWW